MTDGVMPEQTPLDAHTTKPRVFIQILNMKFDELMALKVKIKRSSINYKITIFPSKNLHDMQDQRRNKINNDAAVS